MGDFQDNWAGQQRRRWMRPNAHLWIKHDAWRYMAPGAPRLLGRTRWGISGQETSTTRPVNAVMKAIWNPKPSASCCCS
jgi:hypothetical protein